MSFITGKYVHQIDNWMIGFPLSREEMTWARRLDRAGVPSTMLGKMDFCGDYQDGGFTHHRILRRRGADKTIPYPSPWKARRPGYTRPDKRIHVRTAGSRSGEIICDGGFVGESNDAVGNYDHDRIVTNWALEDLRERGAERRAVGATRCATPWALYVGLLMPHWPFRVPEPYFSRYYPQRIEMPVDYAVPNERLHPAVAHFQRALDLGTIAEDDLRKTLAAYYGMTSCMDAMVGEILGELEAQRLSDDTVVIYTSDHGESLGEHGLFYKQCSYEGSAGVPLIVAGPGVTAARRIDTPVDLVSLYPTVLDIAGLPCEPDRRGRSWMPLVTSAPQADDDASPSAAAGSPVAERAPDEGEPFAFSEFHANFFTTDWYLVATQRYKYTYYVGDRPTLFDIERDPNELADLAADPAYGEVLSAMDRRLRSICDPEATALRARRDLGLIGADGTDYTTVPLSSDSP